VLVPTLKVWFQTRFSLPTTPDTMNDMYLASPPTASPIWPRPPAHHPSRFPIADVTGRMSRASGDPDGFE
jgi:hypothetical protein